MPSIRQVATWADKKKDALAITYDDRTFAVNSKWVEPRTAEEIEAFVVAWAANASVVLPPFGIRKNADGSLAIWLGEPPPGWPNDPAPPPGPDELA